MKRLTELQKHEELRKFFHITAGCGIATASLFVDRPIIIAGLIIGLILDILLRERIHTIQKMIDVGRRSYGDYAYVAGIVISAVIFPRPFTFIAACLVLALGDGLAGLIGRIFGQHHYGWFGADKTYLGSSVFFMVSYFVVWQLLIASQISAPNAFIGALIIAWPTTLLEASIGYGFDNFAVPIMAGILFELMV
jgi:phytol kinase